MMQIPNGSVWLDSQTGISYLVHSPTILVNLQSGDLVWVIDFPESTDYWQWTDRFVRQTMTLQPSGWGHSLTRRVFRSAWMLQKLLQANHDYYLNRCPEDSHVVKNSEKNRDKC